MRNVKDFGAFGDGIHKDTAAIQKAIDAGGMVQLPPGVYLSGTLYLKSNGGLFLEPGAVLLASPDREDYNADDFCVQNSVFSVENVSGAHFITAVEQHDITICGGGRIDGNRQAFFGEKNVPDCEKHPGKFPWNPKEPGFWRPAQMIFICECNDVRIQDVQLYNAPYWTCFLHGCCDAIISGLRILNDQRTYNGDGIDIDCCQRVAITNCLIDSGDDCITLRGNERRLKNPRPCEFITVSNCVLHTNCNAFRIGVGNGTVRHAAISNIVFHHTRTAVAINSNYSTDPAQGVQIEDISFNNLQMECERPFVILSQVRGRQDGPASKEIRNISIRQARGYFSCASIIGGIEGKGVYDISFEDVSLDFAGAKAPADIGYRGPAGEWTQEKPDAAFYSFDVNGLSLEKVKVNWKNHEVAFNFGFIAINGNGIELTRCDFGRPVEINGVAK